MAPVRGRKGMWHRPRLRRRPPTLENSPPTCEQMQEMGKTGEADGNWRTGGDRGKLGRKPGAGCGDLCPESTYSVRKNEGKEKLEQS